MKKILCLITIAMFTLNVSAYELPSKFWSINDRYTAAVDSSDYESVIISGLQALELLNGEPENEQVINVRASRLEQIAISYERLGDYNKSAQYFNEYAKFAKILGWDDAVKISNAKSLQYKTDIKLYKESNKTQSYYGAKLENEKGVYVGLNSDSEFLNENNSMILLYLEFGDNNTDWVKKVLSDAAKNNQAVEFAWNLKDEGSQVNSVKSNESYIIDILELIENYNTIPVFIRFGAEFNIWEDKADANAYKDAFRFVSDLSRKYTTNTAMVWSPNSVSSWDIEMNDYYPGDQYVDWVGVSLYMKKYFLGRNDWQNNEKFNEVVFQTGLNADPVKSLNEIMTKYGDRKPIMISESGASHKTRTLNENDTNWAKTYLSMLYNYVPMVYPQVKLIAHFDKVLDHETYDYALSTNSELKNTYNQLINLPHILQASQEKDTTTYEEVTENSELSTEDVLHSYVHVYGVVNPKVNFYVDDLWAHSTTQLPYKFAELSNLSDGLHNIRVAVEDNGVLVGEKCFNVTVNKDISIIINGVKISTDVKPILVNDRTLVPIRVIAEGLGATVKWEEENSKVYIN